MMASLTILLSSRLLRALPTALLRIAVLHLLQSLSRQLPLTTHTPCVLASSASLSLLYTPEPYTSRSLPAPVHSLSSD